MSNSRVSINTIFSQRLQSHSAVIDDRFTGGVTHKTINLHGRKSGAKEKHIKQNNYTYFPRILTTKNLFQNYRKRIKFETTKPWTGHLQHCSYFTSNKLHETCSL